MLRRSARRPIKVRLEHLTDGEHTITVVAVDSGRNVATNEQTVLVDTTEKLGDATLTAGARGKDVRELQRKLRKAGFLHRKPTGVLDAATLKAVKRFETHMGMEPDGVVGPRVVGALSGRIVVDLSECRLYLYKDGKLVKTYSVAVGQPAYPTPTGDYYIVSMIMNPTWIPPDSPWARGLEPIPPGPGNPVGTRWIGTSAPGVGIHGTPSDYSIGTHASHGCIRMHMWDVENLFALRRRGHARPHPAVAVSPGRRQGVRSVRGARAVTHQATHASRSPKRAQRSRLPPAPSLQKTERQ